jgi:hypothetical protein
MPIRTPAQLFTTVCARRASPGVSGSRHEPLVADYSGSFRRMQPVSFCHERFGPYALWHMTKAKTNETNVIFRTRASRQSQ